MNERGDYRLERQQPTQCLILSCFTNADLWQLVMPLLLAFLNLTQQLLPLSHPKANGDFHSGVAGHKKGIA